jgi:hypothetical protein
MLARVRDPIHAVDPATAAFMKIESFRYFSCIGSDERNAHTSKSGVVPLISQSDHLANPRTIPLRGMWPIYRCTVGRTLNREDRGEGGRMTWLSAQRIVLGQIGLQSR